MFKKGEIEVIFNQREIPKDYLKESYDIASEKTLAACFFKLYKKRPDGKMVFWKDESGKFSNSLSNAEILNYA